MTEENQSLNALSNRTLEFIYKKVIICFDLVFSNVFHNKITLNRDISF